jgi:hypothetical protein
LVRNCPLSIHLRDACPHRRFDPLAARFNDGLGFPVDRFNDCTMQLPVLRGKFRTLVALGDMGFKLLHLGIVELAHWRERTQFLKVLVP